MSEGIGSIGVSSTWQGSTLLSVVLPLLPSLVVASVTPAVVDEVLVSPLVEVSPLVDVEVPLALSLAPPVSLVELVAALVEVVCPCVVEAGPR